MIKEIEELLYSKTLGKQSDILFAHWNYDKKIIPSALNAVSNLFPHYSLHDESHSETIINNIVRVIGFENIKKLSAIDLWLILEASYSHDLGMVVTSDELVKALTSNEFLDFFKDLQEDSKNGLHEFADQFEIANNKIKYKHDELNLEYHDGIKFILAEFFRRSHSDRSKEIILNPTREVSLATPRGVIPNRIFKILGDICSSHTKDFDDVMKLPISEVGIDVEDAHPRLIACMLRIGDLLDLDNNRFSEVMLRTLSKIPIDTLNHKTKHLSIESFRVDNQKIEVFAKCNDYDVANITQHWFNYIDSEIRAQMINWNDIIPFKDFGYLPTIGTLKVELDKYEYLDGKKKPKFSVDTDKALSLLQGAGLYEHAYQSIRELLQNAVDSTLIRIWLEHKDDHEFKTPQDENFFKFLQNYPIEVSIEEKEVIGNEKLSLISIKDNGTGISTEDLKYLMNTGSSSKNRKKVSIVDQMPEWLRPSGIFGIGFQSIFMLTDEVVIETKSYFTEEFQRIELHSPNSIKDGAVLIQKKKTNHSIKPGSIITIAYKTDAIPQNWSIKNKHNNALSIARNFDPLTNDSLDINLGMIIDEILEFENASIIPIKLFINSKQHDFLKNEENYFKFFEKNNSLEINISTNLTYNDIVTFYKNQHVEAKFSRLPFIALDINIHKQKANKILTLNRNKIKSEALNDLSDEILISCFNLITEKFKEIFIEEKEKQIASMFLKLYQNENDFLIDFNLSQFQQWKNFEIEFSDGSKMNLEDLINRTKTIKFIFNEGNHYPSTDIYSLDNTHLTITSSNQSVNSPISALIFSLIEKEIKAVKNFVVDGNRYLNDIEFDLINNGNEFFPSEKYVEMYKKSISWNRSSRKIIPCLKRYNKLQLKTDSKLPYLYHFHVSHIIDFEYPKMASPFVVIENCDDERENRYSVSVVLNDKVYDWVFENRFDKTTTKDDIIKAYDEFVEEFSLDSLTSKADNTMTNSAE
ncbi:ATP-binding protein [Chryseobacterium sp. JJR-5R]|uniref:HD domain-containing protein n=1 Tax=Chryseobacterium sp. JJR-5R TaxID=3093923 RepID=UPI002A75B6E5|nr:ATP-binding protein [Chryseobacterium sp. JJR-5R]WPO83803.1 ATP-binding protein [Chryseobacterium sp. JJR-5R]